MSSYITEIDKELIRITNENQKLKKQLEDANKIITDWDSYGDEYGCSNNTMNKLFVKTIRYITKYINNNKES